MRRLWWGIVLIIIGLWIWLSYLGYLQFSRDWPLIIILWGIYKVIAGIRKTNRKRIRIITTEKSETNEEGKFVKIRVTDKATGKTKVNIKLPIGIVKLGTDFIPTDVKATIGEEKINTSQILDAIEKGQIGKILEHESEVNKVEVYIE
jgi:hypothetical protein